LWIKSYSLTKFRDYSVKIIFTDGSLAAEAESAFRPSTFSGTENVNLAAVR
jgi:hypothetical protein